jgi:hypothetical protein
MLDICSTLNEITTVKIIGLLFMRISRSRQKIQNGDYKIKRKIKENKRQGKDKVYESV